jgi:FkbH-like protein
LKNNGILLGLVSKNDEAAVTEMFATHPNMPLGWTDFSSRVVNWEDKVRGLQRVAQELNLGLNSFVFLDDSLFERALVRAGLPQVRVPETPDILIMLDYLESGVDFLMGAPTKEDSTRAADYAAQQSRDQLRASAPSLEAFLHDLQLVAVIQSWSKESLPRIAQMLQKTNQFNLTTRRHTLSRLEAWLGKTDGWWEGWTLSAQDRFADQGLVGCLLARAVEEGQWEIDSFLLSCRALGRGYETALLSTALRRLRSLGAMSVIGRYIPTGRNSQVQGFYAHHGALLMPSSTDQSDPAAEIVYQFDLSQESNIVKVPAWIRLGEDTPA